MVLAKVPGKISECVTMARFSSGDGVAAELQPDLQILGADLGFERAGLALGVVGVDAVDHQGGVDARVGIGRAQDLADGAAAGAPAAEHHAPEAHAGLRFGFLEQGGEARGILEEIGVGGGAGAGLDADDATLLRAPPLPAATCRRGRRRARGCVRGLDSGGNEEAAEFQLLAAAGGGLLLEARMGPGVLHHGRRILRLLREQVADVRGRRPR